MAGIRARVTNLPTSRIWQCALPARTKLHPDGSYSSPLHLAHEEARHLAQVPHRVPEGHVIVPRVGQVDPPLARRGKGVVQAAPKGDGRDVVLLAVQRERIGTPASPALAIWPPRAADSNLSSIPKRTGSHGYAAAPMSAHEVKPASSTSSGDSSAAPPPAPPAPSASSATATPVPIDSPQRTGKLDYA